MICARRRAAVAIPIAIAAVLSVSCSAAHPAPPLHASVSSGVNRNHASPTSYDPLTNGRSIFTTGRDLQGAQIAASSRPLYPNCVACHRADGSGGTAIS